MNDPAHQSHVEPFPFTARTARRWKLVEPHVDRLRRLVRSRLGNSPDVDDCVQEALVRTVCFDRLDETRVDMFLTTTALRLCVDHYRELARQQRLRRRAALADPSPNIEESVCESHLGSWMLRQADQLQGRERQIILARASGLSTAEAARRYEMTPKAAESAFTRARARMRGFYEAAMTPADEAVA